MGRHATDDVPVNRATGETDLAWLEEAVFEEYERYYTRYLAKKDKIMAEVSVNPFACDLNTTEELVNQRLGRSADSILGNTLESLAHRLARRRYPQLTPSLVLSGTVTEGHAQAFKRTAGMTYPSGEPKTVILTDYDRDTVHLAATAVMSRKLKVGSPEFADVLTQQRAVVRGAPRAEQPWGVILDFYCEDGALGMGEMKAGGHLDNTKAKVEVQEMIVAALVCDSDVPLRAFLCYANRGYGNPISGALPSFFEPSHLLIDRDFWQLLLPDGVSWELFEQIRRHAAQNARQKVQADRKRAKARRASRARRAA